MADTLEIQKTRIRKGGIMLTREENLIYRRNCPYDAMGDYSILMDESQDRAESPEGQLEEMETVTVPVRQ